MLENKFWMVEIRFRDSFKLPSNMEGRVLAYERVCAPDQVYARLKGFDQFAERARADIGVQNYLSKAAATIKNVCAPDALEVSTLEIWENDARKALASLYSSSDIEKVVAWFSSMTDQNEQALLGDEGFNAMRKSLQACQASDTYSCLMARLFIYAPLILKQT